MKHINFAVYKFILLLWLVTGCNREELAQTKVADGKYHSTLMFKVTQPITRSVSFEEEVRRLDIVLFREKKLEKIMKNVTSFSQSAEGHGSVDISFDEEGTRQAYVIANIDDESWLNSLAVGTTTPEEMTSFQTATLKQMSQPPLVMYGVTDDIVFSTNESSSFCDLNRVVSRIDIVDESKDFKLVSARLIRSKQSSIIFPGKKQSDSQVIDFDMQEGVADSVRLYSYENSDVNPESATTIEITGTVNETPLTYTVDFSKDGMQIPVQRGFRYTVRIDEVQKYELVTSISVRPWKVGNDIEEEVGGNKPTAEISIDPATGNYSASDFSFEITPEGGLIQFDVKANADCDISITGDWLQSITATRRVNSFIKSQFTVQASTNLLPVSRSGQISIFNKLNGTSQEFTLMQAPAEVGDKYMIVAVAGQSNATGYDQSPVEAVDLETSPRAFQLSYRRDATEGPSIIPLTWCADDIDARKEAKTNESGHFGLKGIHLPLAKELVKYVPSDYKILVIPVSYSSSRFETTISYGSYNSTTMAPNQMTTYVRWGLNSAYVPTIINRIKYALDLDSRNKFLGIVWCQGENDSGKSSLQYSQFTTMADYILENLNGYADRSAYKAIDKRSWFSYSSCNYWTDWHSNEDASEVFGGYKHWNPDNFIHVPASTLSNPDDGGAGGGHYHFGKNAFREVVAPMLAARMNENGVLFNNKTPLMHFTDQTTAVQAEKEGGSLEDIDIQSSLALFMPFDESPTGKIGSPMVTNSKLSLTQAEGLTDIRGDSRERKALLLTPTGGFIKVRGVPPVTDWSMAFLLKRTGSLTNQTQSVFQGVLADGTQSFIGFKKFISTAGVAGISEFVVEPISHNVKKQSAAGQFMAADKVRSLTDWIHYTVTYKSATKEVTIYMNGDLVQRVKLDIDSPGDFYTMYIGNSGTVPTIEGQLADFFLWSKVIEPATMRKVFLMSYYGYIKN